MTFRPSTWPPRFLATTSPTLASSTTSPTNNWTGSRQKLLELKPNIRKMWSTGGELTNLFQNHEIVAAMGWPLMTNQLRKINFPIGETIPQENTTGWI